MRPNFSKYIEIPFKHKGRDFKGCDCYGLIRLIYEQERSILLPDYLELDYNCDLNEDDETHIQDKFNDQLSCGWQIIESPFDLWDTLIFYANSRRVIADHIGLCIGDDKFIHTSGYYEMSMVSRLDKNWLSKLYAGARYVGKS